VDLTGASTCGLVLESPSRHNDRGQDARCNGNGDHLDGCADDNANAKQDNSQAKPNRDGAPISQDQTPITSFGDP
jgi:hypothetical protein